MKRSLPISFALLLGVFFIQAGPQLTTDATGDRSAGSDLIFNHRYHLEEEGLECMDCHGDVEESEKGLDNLIPSMDVCSDCHDTEDPDECARCHATDDTEKTPFRIAEYSPIFSHSRHLGAELQCLNCHAGVEAKESVEPLILPGMVTCKSCHEEQSVASACLTCHSTSDRLKPKSHGLDFKRMHADFARDEMLTVDGDKTCATCHETDFCQECHEGDNVDRLTHPLNWEYTHALEVQSFEVNCQSCHFDRQFCADCHAENLILPHSHTPGWAVPITGGRHKFEAENDLDSCISCHVNNAEAVCGSCHDGSFDEEMP